MPLHVRCHQAIFLRRLSPTGGWVHDITQRVFVCYSDKFFNWILSCRLKKGIAETSDHRGGFQEKGESLGRTRTVPPPSLASNADRAIAQTSSKVTSQKTTSNGETSHHAFKHDSGFEESVSSLTQDVSHRLGVYLPTSGASNQYNAIFQGITAEEKNIASSSQQQRAREAELLGISDDYSSDEDFEWYFYLPLRMYIPYLVLMSLMRMCVWSFWRILMIECLAFEAVC